MRLKTAVLIVALALSLLAAPLAADAQQPGKVPRIGVLGTPESPQFKHLWDAFRQGLRDLGYVEGQNIAIEWRSALGRPESLPDLAAELVRLKVDVIVGGAAQPARAAKQATDTIPIVMITGGDPVAEGLVSSLARPGGNITGVTTLAYGVVGKQLELLKEAIPRVSRVAILWNPNNPSHATQVREAEAAARKLGVQPQSVEARGPKDFDGAFSAMGRERAEAFVVLADALVFVQHGTAIADLAAKRRLPAIYARREHVEAGGLIAYGTDRRELMRRLAVHVDKILKGSKPADIPFEQPTRFELVINLKTAKALGLTIPQSILFRADHLIK